MSKIAFSFNNKTKWTVVQPAFIWLAGIMEVFFVGETEGINRDW